MLRSTLIAAFLLACNAAPALQRLSERFDSIKEKIAESDELGHDELVLGLIDRIDAKFERATKASRAVGGKHTGGKKHARGGKKHASVEAPDPPDTDPPPDKNLEMKDEDTDKPKEEDESAGLERASELAQRFESIQEKVLANPELKSNSRIKAALKRIAKQFERVKQTEEAATDEDEDEEDEDEDEDEDEQEGGDLEEEQTEETATDEWDEGEEDEWDEGEETDLEKEQDSDSEEDAEEEEEDAEEEEEEEAEEETPDPDNNLEEEAEEETPEEAEEEAPSPAADSSLEEEAPSPVPDNSLERVEGHFESIKAKIMHDKALKSDPRIRRHLRKIQGLFDTAMTPEEEA